MSTSALELDDRARSMAINLCSTPTAQGSFRARGFHAAASAEHSDTPVTTGTMLAGGRP